MKVKIKDKIVYLEETVIVILLVCILSNTARIYLNNYFVCYLFIIFHEASHILIASILGINMYRLNIRLTGMNAVLDKNVVGIKALLIYIAGPVANLILAWIFKDIKMVFEINMAFAIINLVPIKPLDGYNILNTILKIKFSKITRKNVLKYTSFLSEILLFFTGIFIAVKNGNFSLIFLLVYIKSKTLQALKSL